jgi:hypothetical protein
MSHQHHYLPGDGHAHTTADNSSMGSMFVQELENGQDFSNYSSKAASPTHSGAGLKRKAPASKDDDCPTAPLTEYERQKKENRKRKNREAARKCRANKDARIKNAEDRVEALSKENQELKTTTQQQQSSIDSLMFAIRQHAIKCGSGTASCRADFPHIDFDNTLSAQVGNAPNIPLRAKIERNMDAYKHVYPAPAANIPPPSYNQQQHYRKGAS